MIFILLITIILIMFCKECGAEIPDDSKHCRECGANLSTEAPKKDVVVQEESFFKKNKKILIGCCIGLIVIFLLVAILSSGSDNTTTVSDKNGSDNKLSEEDYKAQCEEMDFNKVNKNADKYKGDKFKVSGKIIQIMEDNNGGVMRVAMDDMYDNVVYVTYTGTNDFVEDDYITAYGECDGSYTYTSTIGASITLPKIDAMYLEKE